MPDTDTVTGNRKPETDSVPVPGTDSETGLDLETINGAVRLTVSNHGAGDGAGVGSRFPVSGDGVGIGLRVRYRVTGTGSGYGYGIGFFIAEKPGNARGR